MICYTLVSGAEPVDAWMAEGAVHIEVGGARLIWVSPEASGLEALVEALSGILGEMKEAAACHIHSDGT